MKTRILALLLAAAALAATAPDTARAQQGAPGDTLTAFRSEAELAAFVAELRDERERRREEQRRRRDEQRRRWEEERRRREEAERQGAAAPRPAACPAAGTSPVSPDTAVVHGCVRDPSGNPVAGATVQVLAPRAVTTAGADGRYRLAIPAASLPESRGVTVAASRIGMETVSRSVLLSPGRAVAQDLVVVPAVLELSGVVASAAAVSESITNTQHEGVDEGGIVKVHGDHLVTLRRGRLFTVDVGAGRLRHVSTLDVFAGDTDPDDTWYDELLVSGDQVVVIGYNYEAGGTEIALFHIGADGRLTSRATWHLRSDDYYSSRNYASRLVDGKLVLYTPAEFDVDDDSVAASFPALRRWHPEADEDGFRPVVSATRIYRPGRALDPDASLTLHTVLTCDLERPEMACEGKAVLGPRGRVFYVSPTAVYVWVSDWRGAPGLVRRESMLYRMPLDGGGPRALAASGSPVDQFSFLESGDGHLNVLVRSAAAGDGMWRAERAGGSVALLRVPVAGFGGGRDAAPASAYRSLPAPEEGYAFQNRFVGRHLLYGGGSGWGRPARDDAGSVLYAVPFAGGAETRLELPHGVDRIEAMGPDAVVVGTDGQSLHFTAIGLGARPRVAQRFVRPDASQGELRSHGFFYKPDGPESGTIGLPIRGPAAPGWAHLDEESASVLFLRNGGGRFRALGELEPIAGAPLDDGCVASCVDWYGNARPIFLRGRIFALLGYELVEGALRGGRIRETRRVIYAPAPKTAAR